MAKFKTKKCSCCNGTGKELDNELVGDYLRSLRQTARLSQAKIAKIMKISAPYLCDLEYGQRTWNNRLIADYKKAIGL